MLVRWSLRCGQCHSHCCYNRAFFFFCCGRLYFYGATERTLTTQEQSCLRLQQRDNTHTNTEDGMWGQGCEDRDGRRAEKRWRWVEYGWKAKKKKKMRKSGGRKKIARWRQKRRGGGRGEGRWWWRRTERMLTSPELISVTQRHHTHSREKCWVWREDRVWGDEGGCKWQGRKKRRKREASE